MDITMSMIWDNLSEQMTAHFYGVKRRIPLKRPELYDPSGTFEDKRIYVAMTEFLSPSLKFPPNILLICAGDSPRKVYTRGNLSVIWVEQHSLWTVFNLVQKIYDRYIQWEKDLTEIINGEIDFAELTRISLPFIGNPVAILDAQFYHIAITRFEKDTDGHMNWRVEAPMFPLPLEQIDTVSALREDHKDIVGLFPAVSVSYPDGPEIRCINLHITGRHVGTVTFSAFGRPFRESDDDVYCFFAKKIETALNKRTHIRNAQTATLKSVVSDYLYGNPVSSYRLRHVNTENQQFVCLKIMCEGKNKNLPVEYICSVLEEMLPGCIAIEYASCIVSVLDFSIFPYDYNKFIEMINSFLRKMDFKAGLSGCFHAVREVRDYHHQAVCAYETGIDLAPQENLYAFWDYSLAYMLRHCIGDLSLNAIIPPELQQLQKITQESNVDYWGTLRTYLQNNMNASLTARNLYLHRSTFLARMNYITSMTGCDLANAEKRLWYQMIMHIIDME